MRDAWRDRHILPWLSLRVVAKGFAGTRLGRGWLLLRPALELGGMTLLFGTVLGAPSQGLPYFLFLITGMTVWGFFQLAILFGARSIQYYRRHANALQFGTLLVPIGATTIALVHLVIYGGILAGTIGFFAVTDRSYVSLAPQLLLAPVAAALMLLLAWGVSFWLSIVVAHVLDVRVLLRYVLQLWMLVTPVLYPVSTLSGVIRDVALLNPVTPLVELFRWSLFDIGSVPLEELYRSLGVLAVLLASGIWFHARQFPRALAAMSNTLGDDEDDY
ncbi:MAG TPA: ABC transporter permease [Solirubrobacteraceae bacterium]|nr:ABC transporter permease [Solirubrobacteraceae bacterium]